MSSSLQFFLLSLSFLFFLISLSNAQITPIILPVAKDDRTLQYLTHTHQRTPLVSVNLVVDIGGQFLWVNCDSGYVSSSYSPVRCRSLHCSTAKADKCNNNVCYLHPQNSITHMTSHGELSQDVIALPSKSGSLYIFHQFLFSCAPNFLLGSLTNGVQGMLGLGRSRIALPSQLAGRFNFHRKFALCLPSSSKSKGFVYFGDGPMLFSNVDFSKKLMYTPLIINPGSDSDEYVIGVKSIKIDGISIDKEGIGGTKISTVVPYTTLETSIYRAFIKGFIRVSDSLNMSRVAPVAPFEACFSLKSMENKQIPVIDLVLQSEMVYWRILGENSMVRVSDEVGCLGFLDGGLNPRSSIVIGGYQLENYLLEFDLATSRLGFSSSLLLSDTTCSNYNFSQNFRAYV